MENKKIFYMHSGLSADCRLEGWEFSWGCVCVCGPRVVWLSFSSMHKEAGCNPLGTGEFTFTWNSHIHNIEKKQVVGTMIYIYFAALQSFINAIKLCIIFTEYSYFLLHVKQKHCTVSLHCCAS